MDRHVLDGAVERPRKPRSSSRPTRVTVTLRKKGDLLQVFIGKTKVAEYEKAIPGGVTIILLDQLNASDADRMYARDHVTRFLEQIRPDDRVGLYVFDGNGVLRVVHDFTSDASALVRAVSKLRGSMSLALAGEQDAARLAADENAARVEGELDTLLGGTDHRQRRHAHPSLAGERCDQAARIVVNTNDIKGAIRRAIDDARMTYVLGYYPTDDRWNGRFHRIVVKVNRSGLEVRQREGYFAVATEQQAGSQRTASLNAAVVSPINASALSMTLRVDPVAGNPSEYRLTVRVQPGAIGLERHGDEFRGAIDIVVAQVRADGAEGRSLDKRMDISVPGERLPQFLREGLTVDHRFTLVPSAERLRVIVRDVRTGAVGAIGVSRPQLQAIVR